MKGCNPVGDDILVEKQDNNTILSMPSGMQSAYVERVAFLRNAGARVDALFLPIYEP